MKPRTALGRQFISRRSPLRGAVDLQPLEDRRLYSTAAITNGELVVTGNSSTANTISVTISSDKATYTTAVNGTKTNFAASTVHGLRVNGGSAADSISISSAITLSTVIQPGAGNDTVSGGGGSDNVFDPSGSNVFTLNGGDDYVSGGTGNDTINGNDGNDIAFSRAGNDKFSGDAGNDLVDSGDGTDVADGGSGTDVALNTETRTTVEYQPGMGNSNVPAAAVSKLSSGTLTVTGLSSGANVINVSVDGSNLVVTAGATRNTFAKSSVTELVITGGSAADFVNVDSTLSIPVSINGGSGNDTLFSAGGNDTIVGGAGDDRIYAQGGNDSILGGDGNDTIDAGSGNDTVTGDAGTDIVDGGIGTDTGSTIEYTTGIESTATTTTGGGGTTSGGTTDTTGTSTGNTASSSTAVKPSPVISAMSTTIMAGEALFVHGMNSKVNAGTIDTAHFEWNFGDTSGKYNTLVGFNASHVYDKAGTYTVTLKLTNEKYGTATTTYKVTVTASTRKAIYVNAAGSDSNSGASTTSAVKTFAKATSLAKGKSNIDILFRAGDKFSVTATMNLNGDNIHLASYGSGKATLNWTGGRTSTEMIRVNSDCVGTTIENISIDSIFKGPDASRTGMPHAIALAGRATAVRNVTFYNLGYDINTNAEPTGVLVQDCASPTTYGLRSYLVWCQGSDFVLLGNQVANSTNEHPIRVYGVDRLLIAYNDLANPQAYSFETSKTALNVQKGTDVYIYGNHLRGPRMQVGPLGGADGVNDKSARLTDVVIENNTFDNTMMQMYTGAQNVYLRNNVFNYNNMVALELEGYSSTYGRGIANVNVVNNTFVNAGTQGGVIDVEGSVAGIKVVNNLYKATSLVMGSKGTAAIYAVDSSAFKSFTSITNNIWATPSSYPTWLASHTGGKVFALIGEDQANTSNYYDITKWNALSVVGTDSEAAVTLSSSYLPTSNLTNVATGVKNYLGVFGDYTGKGRSITGAWSIGAVQV